MLQRMIRVSILFLTVIGLFLNSSAIGRTVLGEDEKLIWVGVGAFQDGFLDIAEKQFSQFIKDYPDHTNFYDVCYLFGKTLFQREKLREARSIFLKIINEHKQFEHTEYILFWLADIEIRLGNNEGARRYLLTLLNRFPRFDSIDRVYYLLGLIEFGSNRPLQAESYWRRATSLTKEAELIQTSQFWLGILSIKQKRLDEAISYLKGILPEIQATTSFYMKYALLWMGEAHLKLGKFSEARNIYRTFYEQFKGEDFISEVHWKLGYCEYQLGHLKEAITTLQSFKNQFKESPFIPYTYYLLGNIYLHLNDPSSSIKELNLIFTKTKESPLWGIVFLSLFWNHIQQNDPIGANKVFQRLQKLNHFDDEKATLQWLSAEMTFGEGRISDALPYYFNILNTRYRERALCQIGKGYFYENKFREAITNFDILLLEYPNSSYREEVLFLKGECLNLSGQWAQALKTYELLTQNGGKRPWKLFALVQMGNLYFSFKESTLAERAFKRAIQDFPDHPLSSHAAFRLGKLFFRENNILEAIHYYSLILSAGRRELLGGAYFSLGEIFYQQEKYDKASKSFETALQYLQENSPWFFLTHLEIGNLQRKKGKYEEARRSYLTILNQAKDEEIRRAASELLRQIGSEK